MAVLQTLLEFHADVNSGTRDGYTPLHSAVLYANPEVARILVNKGADINARGKSEKEPRWLKKIRDRSFAEKDTGKKPGSPLHIAAKHGHVPY